MQGDLERMDMNSGSVTTRISAGGVVYRKNGGVVEVALILVAPKGRWQLPKGTVGENEPEEAAALREVREETGLQAELLEQIDRIDYWFNGPGGARRMRYHKFVSFYLMKYISGSVEDHDHEVEEARWVEINHALKMLAFNTEREVVRKAQEMIAVD